MKIEGPNWYAKYEIHTGLQKLEMKKETKYLVSDFSLC